MKLLLILGNLLASLSLLPSPVAGAGTMSLTVQPKAIAKEAETAWHWNGHASLGFAESDTAQADLSSEACLKIDYAGVNMCAYDGPRESCKARGQTETITFSSWNTADDTLYAPNYSTVNWMSITVHNICEHDVTGYFRLWENSSKGWFWTGKSAHTLIPASRVASVTIDNMDLPKTTPGTSHIIAFPIHFDDGAATCSVRISGEDLDTSGTLKLNGSDDITLTPTSTKAIDGTTGRWIRTYTQGLNTLREEVSSSASAKSYKSTLTATLSCE